MKKIRNILIALVVLGTLLIPKLFCGNKLSEPNVKGGQSKMPVKVSVEVVKPAFFAPTYQVSGTLVANEMVQLFAETQGLIRSISFKEGSRVQKGQLLVKINDSDFQAQLKKALANKKLRNENLKRNEALLKKEAIAQADFDLSEAELNAIDADIDFIKEQIRKTEVRAPFSGVVGLRNISEGAFIAANTNIATLQDESRLKLDFSVPEKYALLAKIGDEVSFTVSGSSEVFKARIYARESAISSETRTIRMKAICHNTTQKLLPGLFANIVLNIGSNKQSIMIPTQCVVPVLKGQKVYLVQGDSTVEQLVETGFRTDKEIEITAGLEAGDSLVLDGIMYMKKGVKVIVGKSK
ncbi:MAG: efflux RND transporter periplasmic adaptor subunit [bacterium]|nr:efflux RND transporter periplasmic adaptor subunit [bacterium]